MKAHHVYDCYLLLSQCLNFGPIFRKWSEILTFPPNWSELGILFHEKLEKWTFHMKLVSIFALKLRGTNPPMGCITTSLVTVTFSVQIEDASLANAMSMTLLTTHFSFI